MNNRRYRRVAPSACHLLLATCLIAPALPVIAAETAALSERRVYQLPAATLADALNRFAAEAGVELVFDPREVPVQQAPAVEGSYTLQEGFAKVLSGSGLRAVSQPDGSWRLAQDGAAVVLPAVKIVESGVSPTALPEPFAGGQVARGGELGILGNRDMMDTPFTQANYTAELMQNQGARFVADALENDASARTTGAPSSGADWFSIRGFDVGNQDMLFSGLPGIAPSFFNSAMAEGYERIEVLKGPNALLNGVMIGGSVGGAINYEGHSAGR